jgi:hypothetical protein
MGLIPCRLRAYWKIPRAVQAQQSKGAVRRYCASVKSDRQNFALQAPEAIRKGRPSGTDSAAIRIIGVGDAS